MQQRILQAGLGLVFLVRLLAGAQVTWMLLGPRQGLGTGFGVRQRDLLCAGLSLGSGVGPPVFPSVSSGVSCMYASTSTRPL